MRELVGYSNAILVAFYLQTTVTLVSGGGWSVNVGLVKSLGMCTIGWVAVMVSVKK